MANIGNRIRTVDLPRPSPELLAKLSEAPAANVDDALNRMFSMDAGIRALNDHQLCGPAVTVRVPDGDNLFIHVAMDMVSPGDILVVQGGSGADRALMGELMLRYLKTKKIGGVVVDGLIRDLDYIQDECPFPVYARGACPNGPYKNGPGEINYAIACGGMAVSPGDVLLGDPDGVVVVPRDDLSAAAEAVGPVQEMESSVISRIDEEGVFIRPWMQARINELGTITSPQ